MQRTVSIVTPTFNSVRTLRLYMDAIISQTYPHEKIEIIIVDGGSTDGTIELIKEYIEKIDINILIYTNRLKTAEAGKAVGVRKASNEIIALLDSDNIIPYHNWLYRMMQPFNDDLIVASEPIKYTYRKEDNVINRYCALIGMNDPLCMFTGNYDRYCTITGKWTEVDHEEKDYGNYLSVKFRSDMIPTIGANGFFMRRKDLIENFDGDYLFDIDVLWELFSKNPEFQVAKVKTGIVHMFCSDIKTFYRKQNRRVKDFLYFSDKKGRKYPWNKIKKGKIIVFMISCVTMVPLVLQSLVGYSRKKDFTAWCFHIVACWITLWVYGWGVIIGIYKKEAASREMWRQ